MFALTFNVSSRGEMMRSSSLLTKLIIFGCIVSILPVIFVGIFSYIESSRQVQEKVNYEKMQKIKQVSSSIEQVLSTTYQNLNNIADTKIMDEALESSLNSNDFLLYRDLKQEMSKILSYDSKVKGMTLINLKNDWIINSSRFYQLDSHPDKDKFLSYLNLESDSEWTLLNNSEFSEQITSYDSNCGFTISLVEKLPMNKSEKQGLVFANIPTCELSAAISDESTNEQIFVTNNDNEIIIHSDSNMIGKSLMESGYVKSINKIANQNQGQFDITLDNSLYTLSFYKSDFNDWSYFSVSSIEDLTAKTKNIAWLTFYVTFFIIIASVLTVWIITRRIYSPVNELINFIERHWPERVLKRKNELQIITDQMRFLFSTNHSLKEELNNHVEQVQLLFYNRLFLNRLNKDELLEKLKYFKLEEKVNNWNNIFVLTLQVETKEIQKHLEDMSLIQFSVTNVVEESIDKSNRFVPVWIDNTLVTLVGLKESNKANMEDALYDLTEKLKSNIEKYLKLSVSIGVSNPLSEIENAHKGYEQGMEALRHRIYLGNAVIIHYSDITSNIASIIYEYPQQTEEELILAIKIGDEDKAWEYFEEWSGKVFSTKQTPRGYQVMLMCLLNSLLEVKQEGGITFKQINVFRESLYEELITLQSREEVEYWFSQRLIHPLIKVFSERRDSQFHNLSEKVINLIHEFYDTDITLEECARKLHYNANYLSTVFRQETNHTFSEYLSMYRFKLAKRWLRETDMTVKEIAEKLKYNNSQNFIRSFKKNENVTPGEYRKRNKYA